MNGRIERATIAAEASAAKVDAPPVRSSARPAGGGASAAARLPAAAIAATASHTALRRPSSGRRASSPRAGGNRQLQEQLLLPFADFDDRPLAERRGRRDRAPTSRIGPAPALPRSDCSTAGTDRGWRSRPLRALSACRTPASSCSRRSPCSVRTRTVTAPPSLPPLTRAVFELDLEIFGDRLDGGGEAPGVAGAQRRFERALHRSRG